MASRMLTVAFSAAEWILARFPQRLLWNMATIAAYIAVFLHPERIRIAEENIRSAYQDISTGQLKKIVFESARNLFHVFFEIPFIAHASREEILHIIRAENMESVKTLIMKHGKVVFVSAHFGNWEYAALTGPLYLGCPVTIVGKPQKNVYVDNFLNSMRERFGNKVIPMNRAVRRMMELLETNHSIALLVDQAATPQDIFVDFFGRNAPTYKTAAALSLRCNAPLIFGLAERQPDLTYIVKFKEIPSADLDGYNEENVRILTERHVKVLENAIREQPGQWLWFHRRWKHAEYATAS